MFRSAYLFALLLMVLGLTACEPVYKTDYAYVPPKSNMGQMCTTQCIQNKSSCEQMCQMSHDSCVSRARSDAYYAYESYRHDREREGKEIKRNVGDFDNSYMCSKSCQCLKPYNSCYSACGGDVLEKKRCVAFCGKEQQV